MNILPTDESWRYIRTRRHNPPWHANRGKKKLVFAAAMQQSQQFFQTADAAGYEIKPILLYYGLNQAVRAIAAADISPRDKWTFNSHGISCPNLDQNPGLGQLEVVDKGDGAFQALARSVGSPTLSTKVPLGELWLRIPEASKVPLQGFDSSWRAIVLRPRQKAEGIKPLPFTADDGDTVWQGEISNISSDLSLADLTAIETKVFEMFPAFQRLGLHIIREELAQNIALHRTVGLKTMVTIPLEWKGPASRFNRFQVQTVRQGASGYSSFQGSPQWFIPCLEGDVAPLHPICTWWSVLYAMSMLARYQPANWTKMLDIDSSPDAPAIEYVLDEAHRLCAHLIRSALLTVDMHESIERRSIEMAKRQIDEIKGEKL